MDSEYSFDRQLEMVAKGDIMSDNVIMLVLATYRIAGLNSLHDVHKSAQLPPTAPCQVVGARSSFTPATASTTPCTYDKQPQGSSGHATGLPAGRRPPLY